MNLNNLISILDNKLNRECVMYKSPEEMQKTINYHNTSHFTININEDTYEEINQVIFINENSSLYLYLITDLFNKNHRIEKIPVNEISTFEVIT